MSRPHFKIQHRVRFHETDLAGIVHFANFYRYAEDCEHAFLAHLGHAIPDRLPSGSSAWPKVRAEAVFKAPARFGSTLDIGLWVVRIGSSSIHYRIKVTHAADPLAELTMVVAHAVPDADGRMASAPIPETLKEQLLAICSG